MSFSFDNHHKVTQSVTAHSHSHDTHEYMEQSQNLYQNEVQQNLSTDIVPDSHQPQPHSSHQPKHNTSENNHSIPLATEPISQKTLPSNLMVTKSKVGIFKLKLYQTSTQNQTALPVNTAEALKEPNWKKAMEDEYTALMKNET